MALLALSTDKRKEEEHYFQVARSFERNHKQEVTTALVRRLEKLGDKVVLQPVA